MVFSHDAQAGKRCTSSAPEARCRVNESTTRAAQRWALPAPSQTTAAVPPGRWIQNASSLAC